MRSREKNQLYIIIGVSMALLILLAVLAFSTERAAASQGYGFTEPAAGSTYTTGENIPVSFYCRWVRKTTYVNGTVEYAELPVTLKVMKGKKVIYTREFTHKEATTIDTTYVPATTGTLKLCLYAMPMDLYATEQTLQDTVTVKVKARKATDVKSIKPNVFVQRTAKNKAEISCTNNKGFGMKVWRAEKKKGKYKLVKTTSKAVWTDSKLKASKVYYYKVRLYAKSGKKVWLSKWSKVLTAGKYKKPKEPVERPVIKSVKRVQVTDPETGEQKYAARITWKRFASYKPSNVSFMVCSKDVSSTEAYSPISGHEKLTKIVWSENEISTIDPNAESGKTYLYNVYASSKVVDWTCDTLKPYKFTMP